jgi:hypothetical protein
MQIHLVGDQLQPQIAGQMSVGNAHLSYRRSTFRYQ